MKNSIIKHIDFYNNDKSKYKLHYLKFNIIEDLKYYQLMFKKYDFHKENEFRIIYKLSNKIYEKYKHEFCENSIYLKMLTNDKKPVLFLEKIETCNNDNVLIVKDDEINNYDY